MSCIAGVLSSTIGHRELFKVDKMDMDEIFARGIQLYYFIRVVFEKHIPWCYVREFSVPIVNDLKYPYIYRYSVSDDFTTIYLSFDPCQDFFLFTMDGHIERNCSGVADKKDAIKI